MHQATRHAVPHATHHAIHHATRAPPHPTACPDALRDSWRGTTRLLAGRARLVLLVDEEPAQLRALRGVELPQLVVLEQPLRLLRLRPRHVVVAAAEHHRSALLLVGAPARLDGPLDGGAQVRLAAAREHLRRASGTGLATSSGGIYPQGQLPAGGSATRMLPGDGGAPVEATGLHSLYSAGSTG